MSEQRHTIKRQIVELTVADSSAAGRLHDEVSRIYRQRLVPLIDQACSELSAPDRLHRIEVLELDLGAIDADRLEAELVAKVGALLRPALAARIAEQARSADQPRASPSAQARSAERAADGSRPEVQAQLELLAVFARTGSLPWWADATAPRLLEDALRALLAVAPQRVRELLRELADEQRALGRIVGQLPDGALALLAVALAPALERDGDAALLALTRLLLRVPAAASRAPSQLRRSVWVPLLHVAGLSGAQYPGAVDLYQAGLRRVAAELRCTYPALLSELQAAAAADTQTRETVAALLAAQAADALPPQAQAVDAQPPQGPRQKAWQRPEPAAAPASGKVPGDSGLGVADELYIGNAGLVILWPFLPGFCERLGLLAGGRFKDRAAQQRAVGLLQHIASGADDWPEFLLPLNKLLCGLEPIDPFDFGPPLQDREAAECAALLDAVIAQAPILRDMSHSGFRGTFLLRAAVLSVRDAVWLLRVERQTYDLVLERFPWSWAWVRLPWMAAPLRVEWTL